MKILILGVTGMLGHAVYDIFQKNDSAEVWGTLRHASGLQFFSKKNQSRLIAGVDVLDQDALITIL